MYRAQPVVNKVLDKRWQDIQAKIHKQKIKDARTKGTYTDLSPDTTKRPLNKKKKQ